MVLSGLQLDEVDMPRRGASRANSVRFDDSATTNHWIHDSSATATSDYFNTGPEGIGGYPMGERSSSHKSDQRSDGRQSSLRSFSYASLSSDDGSGLPFTLSRENSGVLEYHPSTLSGEPAPAIIRCLPEASDELFLYAVVCTGSAKSLIDMSVVTRIGLEGQIKKDAGAGPRIELVMWLPDAVIQQHSRGSGATSILRVTVTFTVIYGQKTVHEDGDVNIFLGSDFISSHMADVLFSQRKLLLCVDDGRKVYVPFRLPESKGSFSDICTTHTGDKFSDSKGKQARSSSAPTQRTTSASSNPPRSAVGSTSLHVALSSPKPISGRQASIIRDPTVESSPGLSATAVEFTPRGSVSRGGKTFGRWESFSGLDSGALAIPPERTENDASTDEDAREPTSVAPDEPVMRGRSLTNPPAGSGNSGGSIAKLPGGSVWSTGRKGSLSYAAVQKDGGSSSTPGSKGTVRGTSRGMKVLRTSKSTSLSEARSNHHASGSTGSPAAAAAALLAPQPQPRPNTPGSKSTKSAHSRTNSSDGPLKVPGVKTKTTSNVVGGATAFHWMAPKEEVGEQS